VSIKFKFSDNHKNFLQDTKDLFSFVNDIKNG
jgi:hypothetical protein